jgi:hypothetical protein
MESRSRSRRWGTPRSLIFISYSRRDQRLVSPVVNLLRAALIGLTSGSGSGWELVFQDIVSIPPGVQWRQSLERAIKRSKKVFLFWCSHSFVSVEVKREYELALSLRKTLVPVILDDTPLPHAVAKYQGVDLRPFPRHRSGGGGGGSGSAHAGGSGDASAGGRGGVGRRGRASTTFETSLIKQFAPFFDIEPKLMLENLRAGHLLHRKDQARTRASQGFERNRLR